MVLSLLVCLNANENGHEAGILLSVSHIQNQQSDVHENGN
jgi:hypothetical protein